MNRNKLKYLTFATLTMFSQFAAAHTGVTVNYDLFHGFQHVVFGLDHILAMLGLGMWASSQSDFIAKRGVVTVGLFILLGALLGWMGVAFVYLELSVILSVLAVGIVLSLGVDKCPRLIVLTTIAVFASIHGLTHGHEMPATTSVLGYILGIVLASLLLYLGGWLIGLFSQQKKLNGLTRFYGALVGITGAWLLLMS
jgi:urease accessory protein